MNTYHAFYKGQKLEVKADTTYAAQKLAAAQFKAKKSFEVVTVLVGTAKGEVTHTAID